MSRLKRRNKTGWIKLMKSLGWKHCWKSTKLLSGMAYLGGTSNVAVKTLRGSADRVWKSLDDIKKPTEVQ